MKIKEKQMILRTLENYRILLLTAFLFFLTFIFGFPLAKYFRNIFDSTLLVNPYELSRITAIIQISSAVLFFIFSMVGIYFAKKLSVNGCNKQILAFEHGLFSGLLSLSSGLIILSVMREHLAENGVINLFALLGSSVGIFSVSFLLAYRKKLGAALDN